MKQKEEKERIRNSILKMAPALKILNCEEIYSEEAVKPIENIVPVNNDKAPQPQSTKNEFMNLEGLDEKSEKTELTTRKTDNKKQNENVI